MAKVTAPAIASTVGTRLAAPGATKAALHTALWDIENQRREGKTDAHEALATVLRTVDNQRRAG